MNSPGERPVTSSGIHGIWSAARQKNRPGLGQAAGAHAARRPEQDGPGSRHSAGSGVPRNPWATT